MKKFLLFLVMIALASCSVEIGKVTPERKQLYDHNNSQEFCKENPDKCVNGIPWM